MFFDIRFAQPIRATEPWDGGCEPPALAGKTGRGYSPTVPVRVSVFGITGSPSWTGP